MSIVSPSLPPLSCRQPGRRLLALRLLWRRIPRLWLRVACAGELDHSGSPEEGRAPTDPAAFLFSPRLRRPALHRDRTRLQPPTIAPWWPGRPQPTTVVSLSSGRAAVGSRLAPSRPIGGL